MIPNAIKLGGIEAFVLDNSVVVLKNGNIVKLTESLDSLRDFYFVMSADQNVETCLEAMGFEGVAAIEKFVACRFGEFDHRCDLSESGVSIAEYWSCPHRGKCVGDGVVCIMPSGPNGRLTPREVQIIKLICHEKTDMQIADELGIAITTVHKHRQNIQGKLDTRSVVGVVKFAIDNNIYQHKQ